MKTVLSITGHRTSAKPVSSLDHELILIVQQVRILYNRIIIGAH